MKSSLMRHGELRETLLANSAEAGFPGLLPCMGPKCEGKHFDPAEIEFAETYEIARRSGITLKRWANMRDVSLCRDHMARIREREIFHDV